MADEDANELAPDGLLLQLDGMLQARPQFAAATGREFRKAVREAQQPKKCSIRMNSIVEQQDACPNFPQQSEMGSAQSWATQALVGEAR